MPHFERHVREFHRTRRRFRLILAALFAVLLVAVGVQAVQTLAAGSHMISGRVYNASTGAGLANVKLFVCNVGTAVTNSTGEFTIQGPRGKSEYCVRYAGGAPGNLTGPRAVNNNAEVGARSAYEFQAMGVNCTLAGGCSADQRRWDRAVDSGFDFVFASVVGKAAVPASRVLLRVPVATEPSGVLAAAAGAPSAPSDFQATVSGSNAEVTLNWTPPSGGTGTLVYKLERSLDQTTWSVVSSTIAGPPYDDKSVNFGVHYYYRLSAVDQDGRASYYVTSDAATGDYSANTSNDSSNSYTSDDSLVTVQIPAGTLPTDADCSVSSAGIPSTAKQPGSQSNPMVMGPYALVCKAISGEAITDFAKPVVWTMKLSGKLKNLVNPVPQDYDSEGHVTPIPSFKYSDSAEALTFNMTSSDQVLVLASVPQGVSPNLLAAILVVIAIIVGIFLLIMRKKQKDTYIDYIRHKYYNL